MTLLPRGWKMADELLGDYVPDEKILEQYGL